MLNVERLWLSQLAAGEQRGKGINHITEKSVPLVVPIFLTALLALLWDYCSHECRKKKRWSETEIFRLEKTLKIIESNP